MWLKILIKNHVLTNLLFVLILVVGFSIYFQLPREQDPTINFNWVQVMTFLPGASAKDIEKQVTDRIEEAIEKVQDIKFVSSTSREGISSVLVRFRDISEDRFDKRLADLRREINVVEDSLPEESERPDIFEITTANAFPTATVVVSGLSESENLHRQARSLEKDLARIPGVDQVQPTGLREPEIQVRFFPEKIESLGVSPTHIADTLRAFYRDISAGTVRVAQEQWIVRVEGVSVEPEFLSNWPLLLNSGKEIRLRDVAEVAWSQDKADRMVRFQGKPAVLFAITKQADTNTLDLVESIRLFIEQRNQQADQRGVVVYLADDQTEMTKSALDVMQKNALFGLILVLLATWLFLGWKIGLLVTIGIPFTLAGTFIAIHLLGQTLNTSVLLAIVISLGMLVDDAVVVVESIHFKLRHGLKGVEAAWSGLVEVIQPVSASVLTTIAAFLPLMLLPGILGKFMLVIPLVVTIALLVSLIEAYWMLPGHMVGAKVSFDTESKSDHFRHKLIHKMQNRYSKVLVKVMRHPKKSIAVVVLLFALSMGAIASGVIRMDFFASDTMRLFYINVTLPASSRLEETIDKVVEVEEIARRELLPSEARSLVSYAGQAFTETAPQFGDYVGQVLVSLNRQESGMRSVEEIIEAIEPNLATVTGTEALTILKLSGGPPVSKAVSIKVRGDDFVELRAATDALKGFLQANEIFENVSDDDSPGRNGLILTIDNDAVNRTGVHPGEIQRVLRILIDGEVVGSTQHDGDKLIIRVKSSQALRDRIEDVETILGVAIPTPTGEQVPLSELVNYQVKQVKGNIRHYNFVRTITLEADINKAKSDTVSANELILDYWASVQSRYPNINLDFTGELDDIQESMNAIGLLFLLGLGLIYIILGTQFQSYFQPLMILVTVPLAFTGVTLGLIVSSNPLSLYTLYGIVALAGISVNAAIVLISTANQNLDRGMSVTQAAYYAARRRVLPILITTLTTVAGLFSLATGLGGKSLLWSPVAIAIVWGLLFSSLLTLLVIPVIYQMSMQRRFSELH